jgi:4-hydroxyacetophenone monooxygenase
MSIPTDDETLRAHLECANLPALLPAIVQLTGRFDLLERFEAPTTPMMGAVDGSFSEQTQREIREVAFETLRAFREGDGARPPLPSQKDLVAMMNWCAGEVIPEAYVPLAIEEAALAEADPRRFEWRHRPEDEVLSEFRVLVIGAGFGGVCAGIRLGQAGIPYTILEKN